VPFEEMESIDQFMLLRTVEFALAVEQYSREFVFHKIYQQLNQFCIVDLSAFYFDVLKDRLYISTPKSKLRRSAQTAIWRIGEALVRLVAPIMTFTSEEVWRYLPLSPDRTPSVHLAQFPAERDITGEGLWSAAAGMVAGRYGIEGMEEFLSGPGDRAAQLLPLHTLRWDWHGLLRVREDVLKALETARNAKIIGGSLEAQVKLGAREPVYSLLAKYKDQLRYLFIVSDVVVEKRESGNGAEGVGIHVDINKAAGNKCERCWNYSIHVGEDPAYPSVCERCSAVLREIETSSSGTESKE
jgi:isoleucyl-tRNA synthetase